MKFKFIVNQIIANANDVLFNIKQRDNCCEPYLLLQKELKKNGFIFEGLNDQNIRECSWVINWEISSAPPKSFFKYLIYIIKMKNVGGSFRNMFKEKKKLKLDNPKFCLMILEPPSVAAESYKILNHQKFDKIFTWNTDLIKIGNDKNKYVLINIPNPLELSQNQFYDFDTKKLITAITGNKNIATKGSTYKEKIKVIKFFSKKLGIDFQLYGYGWNLNPIRLFLSYVKGNFIYPSKFKSYKGTVSNKAEVYNKFKFAVCFENSVCKDYISEKIVDCLRYGCIPIYYGAPNILEYIPSDVFIDYRSFSDLEELNTFLSKMSKETFENYQKRIKFFLESNEFYKFTSKNFVDIVVNTLNK